MTENKQLLPLPASTLQRLFEVVDRLLDTFVELNSRFPIEDFFRAGDVWLAHLRVVHRQGFVFDSVDFVPVIRMISSANCLMVISRGLPRLTGSWKSLIASLKMPSIKSDT